MSAAVDEAAREDTASDRTLDRPDLVGNAALVGRLSATQRDCLRLALEHKTTKEIALLLGMTPHSVDWHMKAAIRKLGVDSRVAAALLLRNHEDGSGERQRLARQSPELVPALSSIEMNASINGWSDNDETPSECEIRDGGGPTDWLATEVRPDKAVHGGRFWLFALPWGSANTLSVPQRLIAILVIAGFSALSFGAVVASLAALRQLLPG